MQTQRKTEEPYILNERNLQQDQIKKTEIAFYFDLEEWQNHWKKFWCSYALANGSVCQNCGMDLLCYCRHKRY